MIRRRIAGLGLALFAAAGLAALPTNAAAITRKRADQIALRALKPSRVSGRVVVFGLPQPLARGSRVSEEAPGAGQGKALAGKTWLFWADWDYDAGLEHPSALLLVDDRSGRVLRREGMAWYPLVNGKRPAFLQSQSVYHARRYHVYEGLPRGKRGRPSTPRRVIARPAARTAPNLTNDCLLVIGDHGDSQFTGSFNQVNAWAKSVGLKPNDVGTAEGLDLRIGVLSTPELTSPPCKDAMIVLIGHGWPKDPINDPTTGQPVPTSDVPQVEVGHKYVNGKKTSDYELVTGSDLGRIVHKYERKVTFKIVVSACFSGRFVEWLGFPSTFPNIKVIAASSGAKEFSWGYVDPGYNALPGSPGNHSWTQGVKSTTANPYKAGEFVNGLFGALQAISTSPSEQALTGGDLGKMIVRATQLEVKGDFTAQLRWTTPQFYVNPAAKVVPPPPPYTYQDAGTAGGKSSTALGLNPKSGMIGGSLTATNKQVVFKFTKALPGKPAQTSSLGTPSGFPSAVGASINKSGQATGTAFTNDFSTLHPFLWSNGVFIDLGTLGGKSGLGNGVNDAGKVVGTADTTSGANHPFLWQNGVMSDLGTLGGTYGGATAINNNDQVAGYSQLSGSSAFHAFRWANGSMTDLGTLPSFTQSYGEAINGSGQVVGELANGTGPTHAFLWNGSMIDLGTLPGDQSSLATGINDVGQIVGDSSAGNVFRPFLYQNGAMTDLNALLSPGSGWTLLNAVGIDVLGEIAANGLHNGDQHAVMLIPSAQAQLANVVDVGDALNAGRPAARRSGTGFFLDQAIFRLDAGNTEQACAALTQFQTDAAQERKNGYLTEAQSSDLTSPVQSIQDSLGCR